MHLTLSNGQSCGRPSNRATVNDLDVQAKASPLDVLYSKADPMQGHWTLLQPPLTLSGTEYQEAVKQPTMCECICIYMHTHIPWYKVCYTMLCMHRSSVPAMRQGRAVHESCVIHVQLL